MPRHYRWILALAVALSGVMTLTTATIARAQLMPAVTVDGRYHSVVNGIANYDGFDRFRDPSGQPLPGWRQQLGSPG